MEQGLLEKTGKPLEAWIAIVKKEKLEKHGEIIKYLKDHHNFTHGFANFVALKTRQSDAGSIPDEDLIQNQYAKGKAHLKPIFDLLIKHINALGHDIEIVPKKANVSIRRKKQFALIQPSTKTRIDLGLKFKDKALTGKLKDSGAFGSMCSHRIEIGDISEVDAEVLAFLKEAYENAI